MSQADDLAVLAASEYFDTVWYLNKYKDVKMAGCNPLIHYYHTGWKEMRNPGPNFSTRMYLVFNRDVEAAGICPLLHFERYGKKEGRKNIYEILKEGKYVDEKWYNKQYLDVDFGIIDPVEHYTLFGWKEGKDANENLLTEKYMEANPDCVEYDICPLIHYEMLVNKTLRSLQNAVVHFWGIFDTGEEKYFVFSTLLNNLHVVYRDKTIISCETFDYTAYECFKEYVMQEYKEHCYLFPTSFMEIKNGRSFRVVSESHLKVEIRTLFMWSAFSCKTLLGDTLFAFHKADRFYIYNKLGFIRAVLSEKTRINKWLFLKAGLFNTKKDIILFSEFRNITNDNSWQIFNEALKRGFNVYFVTNKARYNKETNENIKKHLLIYNSKKHKKLLLEANKFCCSWTMSDMIPTDYKHNLYFYPFITDNWFYCPHGISYDKNSNFLTPLFLGQPQKVFCSSELEKEYFEDHCGLKNVVVTGYPRMDKWDVPQKDDILFDFTYRKRYSEQYFEIIAQTVNMVRKRYPERKIRYIFHPAITGPLQQKIKGMIGDSKIEYAHASNEENFNEWFNVSKYLITDYSSVAYDFAYRKHGISIYYMPRGFTDGHYKLNPKFYYKNVGVLTYNTEELLEALMIDDETRIIRNRKRKFFKYLDSGNTERVLGEMNLIEREEYCNEPYRYNLYEKLQQK